jgi:hypothetical protein
MVTIACVWVSGNVPYSVEYVTNLRAMVAKHLTRPHDFVCFTDRPWLVPAGITSIPIHSPAPLPGWWAKIQLFRPKQFTGRVLYLDLDTVIVGSLDPIVDYPAELALLPHAGTFEGKDGRRVIKRFNSSVMVWNADCELVSQVQTGWSADVANELWGDQDWLARECPEASIMPASWAPRLSELKGQPPNSDARVVLVKTPKNHIAADLYPWVAEAWRAA